MTYEEEQIKYAEELRQIIAALKGLDEIFIDPDNSYAKILELYKQLNPWDFKYQIVSNFEVQQKINRFKHILEDDYRNKKYRKKRAWTPLVTNSGRKDEGKYQGKCREGGWFYG